MLERRRDFFITSAAIFASVISGCFAAFGQSRRKSLPDPPLPGDPEQRDKLATSTDPKNSQQIILHNREQEFRTGVEKLYRLTNELREELKTTPGPNILSVRMYKRVQEIQKLAKQVENTLKG